MPDKTKLFWVEIVCCSCATSTAGQFCGGKVPVKSMSAEAKRSGWKFQDSSDLSGVYDWQCPRCSKA